ncbi:hypothetical protein [Halomonas halocynthiae]|uniref:hypothetical protein n=1 Tax=Halomonas halocynthiae TaxID=176290 RepID=UPI0003F9E564|nr:hypothetical protein [Halomonas halocynthiae]
MIFSRVFDSASKAIAEHAGGGKLAWICAVQYRLASFDATANSVAGCDDNHMTVLPRASRIGAWRRR